jgi:hypothetical protein
MEQGVREAGEEKSKRGKRPDVHNWQQKKRFVKYLSVQQDDR